jgi:MIP family channel proteins
MHKMPQKLAAEFVGAFALVFFAAGSICADQFLRTSGQTGIGFLGFAVAHGLAMGIMVASLGPVSGGHFNPAITIGFWVTRKLSTVHTLAFWAAQLAGAATAGYALRFLLPFDVWTTAQLGTPDLAGGISRTNGMIIEALLTFFLVFVFFATTIELPGAFPRMAGWAIGLTITIGALFGGPFTGAAFNPARAFGPALATNHWNNHGVYWIGPLAGGVAAGWIYDMIFLKKE